MPLLTIGTQTFAYPDPGSEPGWGDDATGWAGAATVAISSLAGTGTIFESSIPMPAGPVTAIIPGLSFNKAIVGSAEINYRIFRKTNAVQKIETGMISIVYNPGTGAWDMSQMITVGDASAVAFSIDTTGQISYTASSLSGTYDAASSYLRFKTISTLQA